MPDNSYITSLIQYLEAEVDLAWNQVQNGSSTESKDEARVAYNYMKALLIQIEQECENGFFDNSQDTMGAENDND